MSESEPDAEIEPVRELNLPMELRIEFRDGSWAMNTIDGPHPVRIGSGPDVTNLADSQAQRFMQRGVTLVDTVGGRVVYDASPDPRPGRSCLTQYHSD